MSALIKSEPPHFDRLEQYVLRSVKESSRRVYAGVYADWRAWCQSNSLHPLYLTQDAVHDYLVSKAVTKDTRTRHLNVLRRLAHYLAMVAPEYKPHYEMLKDLRTPVKGIGGQERNKRALSPAEVEQILNAWDGWQYRHIRNRAIIAVLFATGVRRSECAALRWDDVDLDLGIITVRDGKGGKRREVAIVGDYGVAALMEWQQAQGAGREWVFCSVRKGDTLGSDEPITDKTIYRAVKKAAVWADMELAPHDARRTLLTEILNNGATLADAQAQAGHAQGSTTLIYAQPADALARRDAFVTRYNGDAKGC